MRYTVAMIVYEDKIYYTYGLADPDTCEVRYIGASTDPQTRVSSHYGPDGTLEKKEWMRHLRDVRGKRPILVLFDQCVGWSAAREQERYYYERYKDGNLFNSPAHVKDGYRYRQSLPEILESGRCSAITARFEQCRREPTTNGKCWQHSKLVP